jgi:uncharacterized protein YndB with AHSA1/START domain
MSKPSFVYVTYIESTPQKVWNALTDPEMTKEYWVRHRNQSDWKPGSVWRHEDYEDASKVDITGTVLERDPPRRLVLTWANPAEAADPSKVSRVTFDIVTFKGAVRLTVTHDDLEPDSNMLRGITTGWPVVLSSLKTMLETGAAMPMTMTREGWKGEN